MKIRESKLVFIDSEVNTIGNKGECKITIPNHPFTVYGGEEMRLTLISFDMRRRWYPVNQSNNEMYLYSDTDFYPIIVEPGVYSTFAELGTAFQTAITTSIALLNASLSLTGQAGAISLTGAGVSFNTVSRKFAFELEGSVPADLQVVCFHVKGGGVGHPNVSVQGLRSDSYEIFGARPTRSVATAAIIDGFQRTANVFNSFLPCSLNSAEAVYLRMKNMQAGNFATYGHNIRAEPLNGLMDSDIIAKFSVPRTFSDDGFEFIQFNDPGNDQFSFTLKQKTIDNLTLDVTDDKGRLLSEVDPLQADMGLLNFKCIFRWDALYDDGPPSNQMSIVDKRCCTEIPMRP